MSTANEWDSEPNRVQFEHAGFPCIIRRSPLGAWCGYVGVPPGHAWHGKGYDDVDAHAHGGLTYARGCDGDPVEGICHKAKDGESDDVWWLGFDCAHAGDFIPRMVSYRTNPPLMVPGESYRNQAYVTHETQALAEQASQSPSAAAGDTRGAP